MNKYSEMTPEERFARADRLATQLFETHQWKTRFAERYGYNRQSVQEWKQRGAPVWALVALEDAVAAKHWHNVTQLIDRYMED